MTANTKGEKFVSSFRTKRGIFLFVIAAMISMFFAAAAGRLVGWLEAFGLPAWMTLLGPLACIFVFALGIINYDVLVLLAFILIGFVRVEPAPFDLLIILVIGMGLLTGKLNLPSLSKEFLVLLGFGGFILANLASALGSSQSIESFKFLGITLYMLVMFLFIRIYTARPTGLRAVLLGFTISAVVNSIMVLLGFLGVSLFSSVVDWSVRGVGFFKDPNVFGAFIAMAMLWVFDRILQPPYRFGRIAGLTALVLLLGFGAFSSLSRAVWINLALSGCIFVGFFIRHAPRKGIQLTIFVTLIALISFLFLQSSLIGDIVKTRWQIQGYDVVRFNIQKAGITAGFSHLFGVGPAGWPNTHSLYVKTFAEQGFLGLASLVLLVGAIAVPLIRFAWNEGEQVALISARILLAILAGQLVNSVVIDSVHWRHFWLLLGIAWAYPELRSRISGRNET